MIRMDLEMHMDRNLSASESEAGDLGLASPGDQRHSQRASKCISYRKQSKVIQNYPKLPEKSTTMRNCTFLAQGYQIEAPIAPHAPPHMWQECCD
jgi:hypothetical protein